MTKQEATYKKLTAALKEYLEANNKRYTTERALILQYCCYMGTPITAAALIENARKDRISKQTVYDTLNVLIDAGLMKPIACNSQQIAFVLTDTRRGMAHLVCTKCGKVTTLRDKLLLNGLKTKKYANFDFKYYNIEVFGECKFCHKITIQLMGDGESISDDRK